MTHTERLEPDLFAGIIELSLADAAASQKISLKPDISDHDDKADGAFKTISETAKMLALPQHVLRFWESKFTQIKPLKLKGGRRYYRPQDIEVLFAIKHLLYKQGYTIKGARKAFSQFKRQKDQPMARSAPPKKPRKNLLEMDDTPLFSLLGSGNAPQSALVQAVMHSNSDLSGEAQRAKPEAIVHKNPAPAETITVPVAAVAKPAPVASKAAAQKAAVVEASALKPMPLLEAMSVTPVLEPEVQRAKAEAANAKKNEAFAQQAKRRDELKNIHSELLELRELLKDLPTLTSA